MIAIRYEFRLWGVVMRHDGLVRSHPVHPTTEDPLATARTYPKPNATQGSEELLPGAGTNDVPKVMTTNILAWGAEAATGSLRCSAHDSNQILINRKTLEVKYLSGRRRRGADS
jgi:hypothetical protein